MDASKKPDGTKKCPKCGEEAGIPILYRYSPDDEDIEELVQETGAPQVWLGGSEYAPEWHCTKCGHEWVPKSPGIRLEGLEWVTED